MSIEKLKEQRDLISEAVEKVEKLEKLKKELEKNVEEIQELNKKLFKFGFSISVSSLPSITFEKIAPKIIKPEELTYERVIEVSSEIMGLDPKTGERVREGRSVTPKSIIKKLNLPYTLKTRNLVSSFLEKAVSEGLYDKRHIRYIKLKTPKPGKEYVYNYPIYSPKGEKLPYVPDFLEKAEWLSDDKKIELMKKLKESIEFHARELKKFQYKDLASRLLDFSRTYKLSRKMLRSCGLLVLVDLVEEGKIQTEVSDSQTFYVFRESYFLPVTQNLN
ncbi:MAG: hypothetical protein QW403_03315 [Candidatus Aenigmatarchaeota archaeon]